MIWDLLDASDRKILVNFVRACSLLTCRIIDNNIISKAHNQFLKVVRLIKEHYGQELITPNIHLSLHLAECCRDYGPMYSFWCYSFERMNGLLGSYPNSRRNIEPELLRIIQQNCRLDELIISNHSFKLTEALELVKSRPTSGSLAMYDGFDSFKLYQFRQTFRNELDVTITGSEKFPGEMLTSKKDRVPLPDDIYDLLIQYYNTAYDASEFEFVTIAGASERLISEENSTEFIVVSPNISQYGRIRIGSEIFGTTIAPRYLKNSYILARFIQDNETIDLFFSEV